MFSVDQNCHPLWDVLPKLQALALRGGRTTHFIEDVDVAFTAIGAAPDAPLRMARERYYDRGGADWGAAVFYSEFLGRLPVDVREFEPATGRKTSALARELGRTPEDLYDEYSPGDNWQLIGPSYAGDRDHHRVIGDLSVAETAPFLVDILNRCEADLVARFPAADSRARAADWLASQRRLLDELLARHADNTLVDLYESWMGPHLDRCTRLARAGDLFALRASDVRTRLLELFTVDYDTAAALYNRAIAESGQALRPLDTDAGELPFFATLVHNDRLCRTGAHRNGETLRIGDREFPLAPGRRLPIDALARAGVRCLAGKAIVLVLQVRLLPDGAPLAVPYRGSLYMPAAHRLADLLAAHALLPGVLAPVRRVRFGLLDRMAGLRTPIALPEHLHGPFGAAELTADDFSRTWRELSTEAAERLASFENSDARERWVDNAFASQRDETERLDARRRELAKVDPKAPELRQIGRRIKALQREMLTGLLQQVATDRQLADIDVWDSRGAIWPWCVALGGEEFYRRVLREAEILDEPGGRDSRIREHYAPRVSDHRPHFDVLDWADRRSQVARFAVLADNVDLDGRSLLDVGCGLGDLLAYLNERGVRPVYTGVDIVPEMVASARKHHPTATFLCTNLFAPENSNRPHLRGHLNGDGYLFSTFEVVFCSGTFNLDLGNASDFLPRAIERLLALTGRTLVFNLLHERTASKYDQCVYHDPADVLAVLAPRGVRARVIDDYLVNDFTVICEKQRLLP
jgi:SAM-dependent methyltransferase